MSSRVRKGPFIPANSDGCTVISKPYTWLTGKQLKQRPCCIGHDEAYWYGGSFGQRLDADIKLRDCVCEIGDSTCEKIIFKIVGWVMYYAVRIGGSPKLPFPWRWRHNVPFELEDIKSGYLESGVDLQAEKQADVIWLEDIVQQQKDEIQSTKSD